VIAIAGQQARNAGTRHQFTRQRPVKRRQRDGAVGDHLNRGATLAAQDHRTEDAVDAGADDHFLRMGPLHHRLHRESVDARAGPRACDRLLHGPHGIPQGRVIGQGEPHAAHVRLVRDVA